MHSVTVKRKDFLEAVEIACAVVPTRTTKDLLYCVHIASGNGFVIVSATDHEICVSHTMSAETGESTGDLLLKADRLRQILSQSDDESATLQFDDSKCIVKCGGRFDLQAGGDWRDFPQRQEFAENDYFTVSGDLFRGSLQMAVQSVDREGRLGDKGTGGNGVLLDTGNNVLASTDTRVVFVADVPLSDVGEPARIDIDKREWRILPVKLSKAIVRVAGESLDIAVTENQVFVRGQRTTISGMLMTGTFVNWKRAKGAGRHGVLTTLAGPLASLLKRSMICADPELSGVNFTFGDGVLRLKSKASSVGQSECELPVAIEGKPSQAEFLPELWLTFVSGCHREDQVEIRYGDQDSPAELRCKNRRLLVGPLVQN